MLKSKLPNAGGSFGRERERKASDGSKKKKKEKTIYNRYKFMETTVEARVTEATATASMKIEKDKRFAKIEGGGRRMLKERPGSVT